MNDHPLNEGRPDDTPLGSARPDGDRPDPAESRWVTDLLAAQPAPSAPDDVVARVLQALTEEQSAREAAAQATTDPLEEALRHSNGGSRRPSHYSKQSLDPVRHEPRNRL